VNQNRWEKEYCLIAKEIKITKSHLKVNIGSKVWKVINRIRELLRARCATTEQCRIDGKVQNRKNGFTKKKIKHKGANGAAEDQSDRSFCFAPVKNGC